MNTIKLSKENLLVVAFISLFSSNIFAQSLKEKAESGDKIAQFQYARSLTNMYPKEEDYQKAFVWLKKSAEQGYAPAQCNLGYCYWAGQGVVRDYEQAVSWYKKSAEQGDETAQYNLGVCYSNGHGVPKSEYSAFTWYKKSAEKGYMNAEFTLGKAYYHGKGTSENNQLAVEWFNKAAAQKHSGAMYYLGECYAHGYGVTKDILKAMEWYEKSADDYDTNAEYALALLYLEGNGVEKDSITAVDLLLHSAGGGCCEPHQLTFDKANSNQKARNKLLELSKLDDSPKQHYFFAMVGCMYNAMMDYKNAEKYYKLAIDQGSYLATIELGLMYFYISANTPQLNSYYDNFEEDEKDRLGLESYMFQDNTACLEYVKTKIWTEQDNVAYWLEKAINYGGGSFKYGTIGYDIYNHLLFVYVDGIGQKRDLGKAIDVVYTCLTDSTYDSDSWYWQEEETMKIAEQNPQLFSKIFKMYSNLNNYVLHHPSAKDTAKKLSFGGLGKCYYKGYGVSKDYNKAYEYLSKAVKYDNCESMELLAACYRYGRGTTENASKDKEWILKATKCGDERAKKIAELRGQLISEH